MKRHQKKSDGKYHIGGKTYRFLWIRAPLWHKTGITPEVLKRVIYSKTNTIVLYQPKNIFRLKRETFSKAGYLTKKGKFGAVKSGKTVKKEDRKR